MLRLQTLPWLSHSGFNSGVMGQCSWEIPVYQHNQRQFPDSPGTSLQRTSSQGRQALPADCMRALEKLQQKC